MTTRLVTGVAILVVAIVFGFIFWNQFSTNQQNLAGGDMNYPNSVSHVPKNDSVSAIETELNTFDANEIDSDSAEFNAQLNGF